MLIYDNYEQLAILLDNDYLSICIAQKESSNEKVILKIIKNQHPKPEEIEALAREHEINNSLLLEHVLASMRVIDEPNCHGLIYEHSPGVSLKTWMINKSLNITEFFTVGLNIIDCISDLHTSHVIHKDISPENILIDEQTLATKILSLRFATRLSHEMQASDLVDKLEGTLAYMAPEQTGRINRPTDYRSDFYALGVLFYEMLSGELPFESDDPLEYVYFHIAQEAEALHDVNPEIPAMLSKIVAKLMAKESRHRYQSLIGLKADLEHCQSVWRSENNIPRFELGQYEVVKTLNISMKIYGRALEREKLLSLFDLVQHGASEFIMVKGYSGVGKTTVINLLQVPIIHARGTFVSGKFDLLQRSTPYTAFTQIFNSLVRQWLALPPQKLEKRKDKILSGLGDMAQVIIDIFPKLEQILGAQPAIDSLAAEQAKARLLYNFKVFMQSISSKEQPLVVFLDDLQWVDQASLGLLEVIYTHSELEGLLLIGAYRDNEVDSTHPLLDLLNKINAERERIPELIVKPLSMENCKALLVDSVRMNAKQIDSLAQAIFKKTQGNPFFTKQFIETLYREEILQFSEQKKHWDWDLDKINNLTSTDNVVELMIDTIKKLPQECQRLLQVASCIGVNFDIMVIEHLEKKDSKSLVQELWPALEFGLVCRTRSRLKFRFIHDRIQQAAYEMIDHADVARLNLQVGRVLQANISNLTQSDRLYEVLDHFIACSDLIADTNERFTLADLSLRAGENAKAAMAYQAAVDYLQFAAQLLDVANWQDHYKLMRGVHFLRAECRYLNGNFEVAENELIILLDEMRYDYDKIKICAVLLRLYDNTGQFESLLKYVIIAYGFLGIHIPKKLNAYHKFLVYAKFKWNFGFAKLEYNMTHLKTTKDKRVKALNELLNGSIPAIYRRSHDHIYYILLKYFNFLYVHGCDERSISSKIMTLAAILCQRRLDFKELEAFVRSARYYLNKKPDKWDESYSTLWINSTLGHFLTPIRENVIRAKSIMRQILSSGNITGATGCMRNEIRISAYVGLNLRDLGVLISKYLNMMQNLEVKSVFADVVFVKMCNDYLELKNDVEIGAIKTMLESELSKEYLINYMFSIFMAGKVAFLSAEYELALNWLEPEMRVAKIVRALPFQPEVHFFYVLVLATLYSSRSRKIRGKYRLRINMSLKFLKKLSRQQSVNYLHLYLIALAEKYMIRNKLYGAFDLYEQAISVAEKNGFVHHMAIANERLAHLFFKLNKPRQIKFHLSEAHYYYNLWGCRLKVKQLEEKYPEHLMFQKSHETQPTQKTTHSLTTQEQTLDIGTILKANQVISKEIVLNKLLEKMLHVIVENTGATRGVYLEIVNDHWLVLAQIQQRDGKECCDILSESLDDFKELPKSLILLTQRTREPVVVDNVKNSPELSLDAYILNAGVKSLICMPIIRQHHLHSIIYLENKLSAGVFTPSHSSLLSTLAGQIAVSLENAHQFEKVQSLYRSTERFVPKQFLKLLKKENIEEVGLGDATELEITVLFNDIRNFTSLIENSTPTDAFAFANRYWEYMAPIIHKHKGYIDQYQGDAILAIFPRTADDALLCAIDMMKTLTKFNRKQKVLDQALIDIGFGISSGQAMLGILGEKTRQVPGLMSDAANTSARIEGLNKTRHTHILLSGQTFNKLKHVKDDLRLIDNVFLKGKSQATKIYEYVDWEKQLLDINYPDYIELFNEALNNYMAGDFKAAQQQFKRCLQCRQNDYPVRILIERCQQFIDNGAPKNWRGAYVLRHK